MHSGLFHMKAAAAASVIRSNLSAVSVKKSMSSGTHRMKTQGEWDMVNKDISLWVSHNQYNTTDSSS
jgi:hypothetical protein